jgi:malate permease and related proteins
MVQRILQIILPVFGVVGVGWLYGRLVRPDISWVNRMNMEVFVPALVLSSLSRRDFSLRENQALILGSLVVVLASGVLAWPVARLLRVSPRTFVPPMMFNNSGNMGLPLALLAFGEGRLPAAVAMFVTSNLLQFTVGTYLVRRDAHHLHLLRSPIVLATAAGVALSLLGWSLPGAAGTAVEMLGQVCLPLMLFSLGVRMVGVTMRDWPVGLAGAVVRPVLGLAIALPLGRLLGLGPVPSAMLILFASLPPAVLNYLLADRYEQEPQKVASIVLVGNLASVIFVPIGLALALRGL